jgi:hypothetical protein
MRAAFAFAREPPFVMNQEPLADQHRVPEILGAPGDCLFHYTRLSTAIESILPTWTLMMNPFSKMRDPRESKRWGLESRIKGLSERDDIHMFAEMSRLAERLKDTVKILSLTQDDPSERPTETAIFGSGLCHPRLWEHYAEAHRGLCVCLDRERLTEMLTHNLASLGEVHHGPVRYADGEMAPEARRLLLDEARTHGSEEALRAHVARHAGELFFTKLLDWETECEYRFVVYTNDAEPAFTTVRNAVRAVVIGAETDTN